MHMNPNAFCVPKCYIRQVQYQYTLIEQSANHIQDGLCSLLKPYIHISEVCAYDAIILLKFTYIPYQYLSIYTK